MRTLRELEAVGHLASKEYALIPNADYGFTLNGSGTWQVWDGAAWKDYEESSGTSQAFVGTVPISGRVQLAVTSGTVTAGFKLVYPNGDTRRGS